MDSTFVHYDLHKNRQDDSVVIQKITSCQENNFNKKRNFTNSIPISLSQVKLRRPKTVKHSRELHQKGKVMFIVSSRGKILLISLPENKNLGPLLIVLPLEETRSQRKLKYQSRKGNKFPLGKLYKNKSTRNNKTLSLFYKYPFFVLFRTKINNKTSDIRGEYS